MSGGPGDPNFSFAYGESGPGDLNHEIILIALRDGSGGLEGYFKVRTRGG